MLTHIVLFASIVGHPAPSPARGLASNRPRVEVWTNRGDDPYHTGQDARVYLRADRDAFVTLFRVDTDGRVRVLFPRQSWEDNFVRGGREFEVEGARGYDAFQIDDDAGVGYVFAVAAADPFDYDPITSGDHWDYRIIEDGRVRGDPYVALTDLAQRLVPTGYGDWDYDIVPYYVERRYDYPRFLCYDCHSHTPYSFWDPYAYSCVRFRVVIYDDPYYYPYRYYGGMRVVFSRPFRPEPRFVFKDRGGVADDRFVSHEPERPVSDNGRRGVRGIDLGGRGSIPAPEVGERRRSGHTEDTPHDPGRHQSLERPDQPARPDDHGEGGQRRRLYAPERRNDAPRPEAQPPRPPEDQRPEARSEPRQAAPKSEPRAAPHRDRDSKSSGGRAPGQPELRRRRP